jgi:flagellar biogenesis protein FliO
MNMETVLTAKPDSLFGKILAGAALMFRFGQQFTAGRRERKMRLCETLSLGERRFLALVLVEQQKFLVGGSGNSVTLLARLPSEPDSAQTAHMEIQEGIQ